MIIKLRVSFSEKDKAKAVGARWDPNGKFWYLKDPSEQVLGKAKKWLPKDMQKFMSKNKEYYS